MRRAAMCPQTFLEGLLRSMEPYRGVVRSQPQVGSNNGHRLTLDDHTADDGGVFGLELLGLGEDAPAIDPAVLDGARRVVIEWKNWLSPLPQFVEKSVPNDATDPGFGSVGVPQLVGLLQCPNEGQLKHVLGVDLAAGPSPNGCEESVPSSPEGLPDGTLGGAFDGVQVHARGILAPSTPGFNRSMPLKIDCKDPTWRSSDQ